MEAIAGASGGGIARCSCSHRNTLTLSVAGKRNLASPGTNYYLGRQSGSLRVAHLRSPFSSDALEDQSHVQYYLNVQHGVRKDRLRNSVCRKASFDEAVEAVRVRNKAVTKAKKMEMKMQKKLKKAARVRAGLSSSSSSSSSSESETGELSEARAQRKRVDLEKLRRDWACISQSPLMNSIPTISSSFVIEQPPAAQQLASPVESWLAAQKAEVVSSAELMGKRISSGVGSHTELSSSVHDHRTLRVSSPVPRSPTAEAPNVEVCLGGKCKKAGAQEVLSAFLANGVNASACNKCMKKCKFAINVRVHQDADDVPQMYSGIGVQDVNALSRKHFGAGTAPCEAIEV